MNQPCVALDPVPEVAGTGVRGSQGPPPVGAGCSSWGLPPGPPRAAQGPGVPAVAPSQGSLVPGLQAGKHWR